ncbi:hypothetical protein AHF37_02312 [Paragonimus kellicotti]|nr:hypothetical protein AHF37_02312 [Paragonimus kellicotti]
MSSSPGYNLPQIQRTFLVPLAREFITSASDRTSVDDFVSFVIKNASTSCTFKNVKTWRKDAFKANENFVASLPTIRLSDIAMTSPVILRRQLKCFLRAHLNMAVQLPVWPSILISGPPFCGKTTLLEAVCGSLGAKLLTVSVGTVSANMKSWIDLFNQAKALAPCVLHLDDVEGMEKHSTPAGAFRVTCLLKSRLLRELIGSGIAVVGETRSLLTSLPQSVVDLFTQRLTFGMLSEQHRLQ